MDKIKAGFRGIVRIVQSDVPDLPYYLRASSVDFPVRREAIPFLPVYGGSGLRRIWHTGTATVTGSISLPLAQGWAARLYDWAQNSRELIVDMFYFGEETRRVEGCKINELKFACSAGELVQVSISLSGKVASAVPTTSYAYTKGQKLVSWTECHVIFPSGDYDAESMQAMDYVVNNDLKVIKTAASLYPSVIKQAIQNISGTFSFYNSQDIVTAILGIEQYGLGFRTVTFKIDDMEVSHDIVFDPSFVVPLSPQAVVSVISWSKSDKFTGDLIP